MNAYTQETTYDSEGRPLRVANPLGLLREMSYDAEGNVLTDRTANSDIQRRYGGFHRLVERTDGVGTITFDYDTEGRLLALRNEAGERYEYELDRAGWVASETSFDGARRRYLRDADGRITTVISPSGKRTKKIYDEGGHVVEVRYSDGLGERFEYDTRGLLKRATNASADVIFERDVMGRLVGESQDGGHTWIRSRIGANGQRSSIRSDLGARQDIEVDDRGQVVALVHRREVGSGLAPARVELERDLVGREIGRALPGGVSLTWTRDRSGRPLERHTRREVGAPEAAGRPSFSEVLDVRSYQWRGEDQIAAIINAASGPTFYDHDRRGRLIRERRGEEVKERLVDEVDNIVSAAGAACSYGAGGLLLASDGVRYEYDADGNQTSRVDPDGSTWQYRWNGAGMLEAIERPDGVRVRFEYDALARRVSKRLSRVTANGEPETIDTRFVWDRHNVLHEVGPGAPVTWYWEPDSFTPVLREGEGQLHSVASDHMGVPTELYDELGELAWKMQMDTFGVPMQGTSAESFCPWRHAGQYQDHDVGCHYNIWRWYDPRTGRYLSPDPLGLDGGLRLYAYSRDPLVTVDPLGLVELDATGYSLYHVTDRNGSVVYVGITNDFERRQIEHRDSGRVGPAYQMTEVESGLTYAQARGYEQADIRHFETRDTSRIGEPIRPGEPNRCWSYDPARVGRTADPDARADTFAVHERARQRARGGC